VSAETVGQRVARVIAVSALLVFVVGAAGVAGLVATTSQVDRLVEQVEPARQANDAVMQDMTDAETGLRGWAISDDDAALVPFFTGMDELPGHQADLEQFRDVVPGLGAMIDDQDDAIDAWVADYANPRLDAGAGPENYDPALFQTGRDDFERIRVANDRIDSTLAVAERDARDDSQRAWIAAVVAMVIATLVGLAAVLGLGRSLIRGIQRPLSSLARVVERVAAGQDGVRAQTTGLREVAAVGEAVNLLAAENERGRAVEAEVHETMRELDRVKNDFVSNVSHELRTPLTSIRGYLELLEDDVDEDSPERAMWEAVNRNVNRLGLLIEDLLTLSKVEATSTLLTEIDLRDVVREVVSDLRVVAARQQVTVQADVPTEPLWVLADATQLLRAVLNVASNAVKFSRPGGVVALDLDRCEGEAVLVVTDTGIGIPADELSGVGRRFFRGSNAVHREIAGTGLGIRIVETILSRHAGSVVIESVEDEGTTVTLRLPIRGATPAGDGPPATPGHTAGSASWDAAPRRECPDSPVG
jgi:signal transduction histidine kinase